MFILLVLNVETNEIEVSDCFNDELNAQNHYLDKVAAESRGDTDKKIIFESVLVSKNRAHIHKKLPGWTCYYKEIYKIVTLHCVDEYNIQDAGNLIIED